MGLTRETTTAQAYSMPKRVPTGLLAPVKDMCMATHHQSAAAGAPSKTLVVV